tara:strand:- start:11251 stop:12186 length:936 start_codon:yes stop_codon:yes gene_type:complete
MNKITQRIFRFLFLVLFLNLVTPFIAFSIEKKFQPYILVGETGKDFEGTEELIIQKFFMNHVEIIGKYRPVDDPSRFIFFITTKQLKKASRNGGENGLFLGVLHLALDLNNEKVYLSIQNIDYWGNLFLGDDYDKVQKATTEFKLELPKLLPKMRGRFMRSFGTVNPLSIDKLQKYQYMKRFPTIDQMIEIGSFDNHSDAVRSVNYGLSISEDLTKLFQYDVIKKNATLFGVRISQEKEIADILDIHDPKATPFYPWQIAVVDGRVFSPAPLFKIPAGFPDISKIQIFKLRKLVKDIELSISNLKNNWKNP